MSLSAGDKLGPYEVLSPIGAGGMGEVWKARDTRLDRTVAIKTSKVEFNERFEREARAVAALNHPHICQLYDVGPNYLVMEFVDGASLKGPMPLDRALALAIQLADAMDAAHRKGITHRDLKPANVLVTKSGIKVLDFGLAKIEQRKTVAVGDATLTQAVTQQGAIVGTLQYMAPEQLQAKDNVDSRADIFSFGCVLYELLTGERAFNGSSAASVIAAILERPAPSIADVAPPALDRVLKTCLAKDPDDRWQTARDLKRELEWIAVPGTNAAGKSKASPAWRIVAAAFLAAAAEPIHHAGEALDFPAASVPGTAIHSSSRFRSRAVCQRSSGSLARHVFSTRSRAGGATSAIEGAGRSRMAAITLAALEPLKARSPVSSS